MRVFHDRQYAFPARAAAETVEEIRQPVLTIFLKQAAGTSANRQNGNRVKNINAASIRNISEIFGDCRLLETIHLVDHANGGVEYRVSAYRAGTFSQP